MSSRGELQSHGSGGMLMRGVNGLVFACGTPPPDCGDHGFQGRLLSSLKRWATLAGVEDLPPNSVVVSKTTIRLHVEHEWPPQPILRRRGYR